MTVYELVAAIWARGGELRVVDGRVRYRGPLLAPDDSLRAAIVEHRAALLAVAEDYEARRGALGRYEAVPDQPGALRETAWSAGRCIHCDATLAAGDRLHCRDHARHLDDDDERAEQEPGAYAAAGRRAT